MTDRQGFYDAFVERLREIKPYPGMPDPRPTTHLWNSGYLDSLAMLAIVSFLEDLSGHELDLSGDFLRAFTTMEGIYDSYVERS